MGRVAIEMEVCNGGDETLVRAGHLAADRIRRASLTALVDTGATMLVLPEDVVQRLGLPVVRMVRSRLGNGQIVSSTIYGPARLTVLGRVANLDVMSVPAGAPALLGQVPLELLDFVVDLKNRRLAPNPESPDPAMALMDLL
jgi:predicted aspartyl protease